MDGNTPHTGTEIRPITRAEAIDYLRVLPFAVGLPNWEPAPAAWYGGEGAWGPPPTRLAEAELERLADEMMAEGFRPQAVFVDGRIVGGSAMLSLEVTIPGPKCVPMGGVTSTGVIATHRRRGLLRGMMTAMLADACERGEFLAGLSASEGGIYGRFGFSPATMRTRWELERAEAGFRKQAPQSDGQLEIADAEVAKAVWPAIHETVRRRRVGEVQAAPDRWNGLSGVARGTDGPLHFLIHRGSDGTIDGIANYRLPWSPDPVKIGTLVVEGLEATNSVAYAAIWRLLTDFDLTRRVVAASRPSDEPLRWMLQSPRALRVTRSSDNLWLRILDVPRALESRSYDVAESLVFGLVDDPLCPWNAGVWRLEASPDGATCVPARGAEPNCSFDIGALASLYLGGMSPAVLSAAGRVTVHKTGSIATLARVFRSDPPPFNAVGF